MFGVVTVKRTSVCVPGVTPPSSTLQKVAGRSSTRTTHCWPRSELTIRSGNPFKSGVLFLLSPAYSGQLQRGREIGRSASCSLLRVVRETEGERLSDEIQKKPRTSWGFADFRFVDVVTAFC